MKLKADLTAIWERVRQDRMLLGGAILLAIIFLGLLFNLGVALFDHGARLINVEPTGEIRVRTNLTFTFSADLIEPTEVGSTTTQELIKFTPQIPGRYRWLSARQLRFLPEAPLRPSTRYQAILKPELVRVKDRYLSGRRVVEFVTERFRVIGFNPGFIFSGEGQRGVQLQGQLEFNHPVSPVKLHRALKLRQARWGKQLKFNLSPNSASQSFTITSEVLPATEQNKRIELRLPQGLDCVDGQLGLANGYRTSMVLGNKQRLGIIEAVSKNDEARCWIMVRCSEPVDPKLLSNFIRIKPAVSFKTEVSGDRLLIKSDQFQSGESYDLQLEAGLPALNGAKLEREYNTTITFADLEPSLAFNSPGRYLSSKGYLNLGLETVNIERVNLEISQIYANNLVSYLNYLDYDDYCYSSYIERMGRVVLSKVIPLPSRKNEMVTTPINLGQYLTENFRGIFQVVVYDDDNRWLQDYKYVIVTDLGIVAKMGRDELLIWVNSLDSLAPKSGVRVSLLSKNNQTIAQEYTNSQGVARFKGINKSRSGFESFIILAELDRDFAFVHLGTTLIPTTDFDVRGRPHLQEGYEGFLYLDRDIFRPGDQGNLVAILRGPNTTLPPEFPVKLEIRQPDGLVFRELKSNTRGRGACEFRLEIPDYAQTGKYAANLWVAETIIGSTSFNVEDFMPERIKVTTKLDKTSYRNGETAQVKVEGINLFGPPAAGRRVDLKVKLEPEPFTPKGYNSFSFGDPDQSFVVKEQELGENKLDSNGQVTYGYTFPKGLTPPAKLRAVFQGTVIEDGGRAVSSYQVADLHCYQRYIGIKPLSEYYCDMNQPYRLKYLVLDTQGRPLDQTRLRVEIFRITWNSIYRRNAQGRYEYASEEERESVFHSNLVALKGEQNFQYTPRKFGKYQIVIQDVEGGSRTSVSFYATGWGYAPWTMESPDKIQLETGRKLYRVGEMAQIQIKAPFSGKALVTVEREKVYDYRIVDLKQNTGVVNLPVRQEYQPNVYVSVHLIRSIKSLEKRAPVRAFGTVPLLVDCTSHQIKIELQTPTEIRPNRPLEVRLKLNQTGPNAYLTLAAVDEGICQLTNYTTPNPNNFFYGKRSLDIDSYDLYGLILPEVEPAQKRSGGGGDSEMEGVRKQNLNPVAVQRVKPVSLWSGLVKLDGSGWATVKLTIPQFNGTLRLMAVAMSGSNFGSAQQRVVVRDPIVLSPTFPRFVASRDRFTVPVSVYNATGAAGSFQVSLSGTGPVEYLGRTKLVLNLKNKEERQVFFNLQAKNTIGKLNFLLQVSGNGQLCQYREELALRPTVPLTQQVLAGSCSATRPAVIKLDRQWLPGTGSAELTVATMPALKFAGSLQYLLGYPYGCVEQTTSKVFPLLYFDSLAQATQSGVFKGGNANYYVNQGIQKLEAMQLRSGAFSYWPGEDYSSDWGSVYAAHFLVEARKAGYSVSDRVYNKMLNYLQGEAKNNDRSNYRLQLRVYALYVLALAGKPQLGVMAYLKSTVLKELGNDSRAQLAAAYFYAGDRKLARELLPTAFTVGTARETGGNFNSAVRGEAIILSALAEIDPTNPAIFKLVDQLSKSAKPGHWYNTQENAFAMMALGKVYAKKSEADYQGEVLVDGVRLAGFSSAKPFQLKDRRLLQGRVTIRLSGRGECYYFLKSSGISAQADLPEYDNGLMVRREYLDRQGNRINSNQITQGELIIAHLTITTKQDQMDNIAVVDLLPAGLEIENPRLVNNAAPAWLGNRSLTPDYLDIRDDRLILFVSFDQSGSYHYYYALRAVSCGEFILPSLKAECMYDPEISSYASSGQISVRSN